MRDEDDFPLASRLHFPNELCVFKMFTYHSGPVDVRHQMRNEGDFPLAIRVFLRKNVLNYFLALSLLSFF